MQPLRLTFVVAASMVGSVVTLAAAAIVMTALAAINGAPTSVPGLITATPGDGPYARDGVDGRCHHGLVHRRHARVRHGRPARDPAASKQDKSRCCNEGTKSLLSTAEATTR